MMRTTVLPTARGPTRQPRTTTERGTPPLVAEAPTLAISRLAAWERQGDGAAVTSTKIFVNKLPGTATADIGTCLQDLCRDRAVCFARPNGPQLSCSAAAHELPTASVITLGLIADLLLTDAYTFGFVPPAGGRIAVAFSALESSFELSIEDSGVIRRGTARRRAFGVTIARRLVRKFGGWLETPRVFGGSRTLIILPRHGNGTAR